MNISLVILCALIALIAGIAIGACVQQMNSEIRTLRSRVQQLEEQTRASQKTRNPYRTNEGLEDAMAIVHDAVWQADATLDYVRGRMRQVDTTLKTIRSEPDQYDAEQPNRKRTLK